LRGHFRTQLVKRCVRDFVIAIQNDYRFEHANRIGELARVSILLGLGDAARYRKPQ